MAWIVPQPKDLSQSVPIADWLELVALVADDGNASKGDVERLLLREGTFDSRGGDGNDATDRLVLDVFSEIERRQKALAEYYPFELAGGLIKRKALRRPEYIPYLFCLCLSYFEHDPRAKLGGVDPRHEFEHLSSKALERFIGGKSMVFGTSRLDSKGFKNAIDALCIFLGEGGSFREQPALNKKDDHLDVVAAKDFQDGRKNRLVAFGQCATGGNWEAKVTELQPIPFWDQWMLEGRVSFILQTFFIPFVIPSTRWEYFARRVTGLFFDRTRVAYWAANDELGASDWRQFEHWTHHCLANKLRSTTAA